MKVLDLFSGIGGFSLGLGRAGMQTVAFCEIDPFCRRVLRKHWPDVPIYGDVRNLNAKRLQADGIRQIDVICGGFPCQDISAANKNGEGLRGKRSGLWQEYASLIEEIKPRFAIIENVANLRSRGLGRILGDLRRIGYDAEWHIVPATAIGAVHERKRVWIIAYPCGDRIYGCLSQPFSRQPAFSWLKNVRGIEDLRKRSALYTPMLCRADDGVRDRVDRLKGLGNAVLPQIAERIGKSILLGN
jgi:DNA (cytosine-5)-methyltransferase 1